MKRVTLTTIALIFVTAICVGQTPAAKPDSLKWKVEIDNTALRNRILAMIDTSAVVINNSDIPAKDRVKTVSYLRSILDFMLQQFETQNKPVEKKK